MTNALTITTNTSYRQLWSYGGYWGQGEQGRWSRHGRNNSEGISGGRVKKSKATCWFCGKEGHKMLYYHSKKNAKEKYSIILFVIKKNKVKTMIIKAGFNILVVSHSSIAVENNWNISPKAMEYLFEGNIVVAQNTIIATNKWIINLWATNHICFLKAYFTIMQPLKTSILVRISNRTISQTNAIGMLDLSIATGQQLQLIGVVWVLSIMHNLIAVDKLSYKVRFNNSWWGTYTICDKAVQTIVSTQRKKGLFRLWMLKMLSTMKIVLAVIATMKSATVRCGGDIWVGDYIVM